MLKPLEAVGSHDACRGRQYRRLAVHQSPLARRLDDLPRHDRRTGRGGRQDHRREQEEFAVESQRRAQAALGAGVFEDEIVPSRSRTTVTRDEPPRADVTLEGWPASRRRFSGTAPSRQAPPAASTTGPRQSRSRRRRWRRSWARKPIARVVSTAVAGVDPSCMGLGPVPATRKALTRAGLQVSGSGPDRAQRGVRSAGHRVHSRPRPRSGPGQHLRRGDRPGPPARRQRRPHPHHAGPRPAPHRRALRARDDVHRGRPGDRDGGRGGPSAAGTRRAPCPAIRPAR